MRAARFHAFSRIFTYGGATTRRGGREGASRRIIENAGRERLLRH
jgi:hypothetical protein